MKAFTNLKRAFAGSVAAIVLMAVPATVFAGYFPANRPTFTCQTPTQCIGADYVTFNSFTNNPVVGDERPFFAGSVNGANVEDRIKVADGTEVTLRAYVHNNADPNRIGQAAALARNVKMKVLVPTAKQAEHNLVSFISASNSNPGTINDTMSLYGDRAFTLDYIEGSASFARKADGTNMVNTKLNDTIIGDGTFLGDMHGCFQYSGYVTLKVKVKMDTPPVTPAYSCDAFNITADVNRSVKVSEFRYSATNGAVYKNATVNWGDNSAEETDTNIIGKTHQYSKDGTYTITATPRFTVDGKEVTAGGPNCVRQVTFKGDNPPVVTPPTSTPPSSTTPTTLVNTGAGSVAGIIAAITAAGALAHRKMLARRLSNQ